MIVYGIEQLMIGSTIRIVIRAQTLFRNKMLVDVIILATLIDLSYGLIHLITQVRQRACRVRKSHEAKVFFYGLAGL